MTSIIFEKTDAGLRKRMNELSNALLFEGFSGKNIKAELEKLFDAVNHWHALTVNTHNGDKAAADALFVRDILPELESVLKRVQVPLELKRLNHTEQ